MKVKLYRIKIGTTLQIFDEESRSVVVAMAEKALVRGEMVTWEDGTTEWVVDQVVFDPTKKASAAYIWDKSGNKVKHIRTRYTKDTNGNTTETPMGVVYKSF